MFLFFSILLPREASRTGFLPLEEEPAREREKDRRALACFFRRHFNLSSLPECLNECSDIRLPASREKRGRSPVRPRTANALLFFTICHTRADDELGRVMVIEIEFFSVEKREGGKERSTKCGDRRRKEKK